MKNNKIIIIPCVILASINILVSITAVTRYFVGGNSDSDTQISESKQIDESSILSKAVASSWADKLIKFSEENYNSKAVKLHDAYRHDSDIYLYIKFPDGSNAWRPTNSNHDIIDVSVTDSVLEILKGDQMTRLERNYRNYFTSEEIDAINEIINEHFNITE